MSVSFPGTFEEAFYFSAGDESLFGIVAAPQVERRTAMVITVPGGSTPLTTHRNRLFTDLCRGLTREGLYTMRFDYHGAGESTGSIDELALDHPFVSDLEAAASHARSELPIDCFAFVGSCFGARTALAGAARADDMSAVVLISCPLSSARLGERAREQAASWKTSTYLRKALRPKTVRGVLDPHHRRAYARHAKAKWQVMSHRSDGDDGVSGRFATAFRKISERRIPVLFLYGEEDGFYQDFERARTGPLSEVFAAAHDSTDVIVLEGRVHGFTTVQAQERVKEVVTSWLIQHVGPDNDMAGDDLRVPSPER